jgi:hypothetical protein
VVLELELLLHAPATKVTAAAAITAGRTIVHPHPFLLVAFE